LREREILGFASAYQEAKALANNQKTLFSLSEKKVADLILRWGELIELRNSKGLRTTEVNFQNGNGALLASQVPRAMEIICKIFAEFDQNDQTE